MKMFHRLTIATIDRFTKTLIKVENWFVGWSVSYLPVSDRPKRKYLLVASGIEQKHALTRKGMNTSTF